MGIVERITFLESRFRPFVDIGLNVQYVPENEIGNRPLVFVDVTAVETIFFGYKWNAVTLNGKIGIGVIYNELIYFKIGYNQGLTKLLDDKGVEVTDKGIIGTIGININALY